MGIADGVNAAVRRISELQTENAELSNMLNVRFNEKQSLQVQVEDLNWQLKKERDRFNHLLDVSEKQRAETMDGLREVAKQRDEAINELREVTGQLDIAKKIHVLCNNAADRVKLLEQTLHDSYPTLAGRVIQLQEAGEEKAAAEWDAVCRKVLAVLEVSGDAMRE